MIDPTVEQRGPLNAVQIGRERQANYEQNYVPIENEALGDVSSTALVDDAQAQLFGRAGIDKARALRNARRYGINPDNVLRNSVLDKSAALRATGGRISAMNNAYMGQYERNSGLRDQLINVGRGLQSDAASGMMSADQAAQQRKMAGDSADAAEKQQMMSLVGTLGAAAIMM